ncbi:MAG TPA: ABC transporter permease, partial [Bryobacteraceae bacterium]|nr:ABC transporter permease [Bryobacteraceae bacterium]
MGSLFSDLRHAFRVLRQNPGFTLVAVAAVALGIGANTAIFSVVNAVLLAPLPYPDSGRILRIERSYNGKTGGGSVSIPKFMAWKRANQSFGAMALYDFSGPGLNLGAGDYPQQVKGIHVSQEYFEVFGVAPAIGRGFLPQEDLPGGAKAAILSDNLWKTRFGGDPSLIGKPILLGGDPYTVVGILPSSFHSDPPAEVFIPMQADPDSTNQGHFLLAAGRLKPGVTLEEAQANMKVAGERFRAANPKWMDKSESVAVVPLRDAVAGDVRLPLLILVGAVGFVLLIACANVANLLLARSATRRREMAIRAALGASQGRMMRQVLTEGVLMALAGGALGLLLAHFGTQAVLAAIPGGLPRMEDIGVDGWVLVFTLAASVATGVVFALAPALQMSRLDLQSTLREGSRGSTGGQHRLRSALMVAEVGASMVLLVGAGLMLRTMWQLSRVRPGFNPRNMLTFSVGLSPANRSNADRIRDAYRDLNQTVLSLPGVQAAGEVDDVPLSGSDSELPFWVSGRPRPSSQSEMLWALLYDVTPGYLHAMDIPLLRGRFVSDADVKGSAKVVVIDETMAKGLFPHQDPIGQSIRIAVPDGFGPGLDGPIEIVGVVGHVKHFGLDSDASAKIQYQIYLPFVQ